MGAWVEVECPVEECSHKETFRLGMGEEGGAGLAERKAILRGEHPDHPEEDDADTIVG